MLIRDLTIQGYRCFEDFSMDGLTRVNLLVGNNNSGKTSFLEAVYLLVNQPSAVTI
jgi:AAA15 family ATPase/GTPase